MKAKSKAEKEVDEIFKHNAQSYIRRMRADIDKAEARGESTLALKTEYDFAVECASMPRQNRIMWYVIRACNELDIELQEIWCSSMKCVFRFPKEKEAEAHFFLYGTSADYEAVLEAVRGAAEDKDTSNG